MPPPLTPTELALAGGVPYWEWAEGKRPNGWTDTDENRSRFSGLLPTAIKQAPRARRERLSRAHVVFDERGEIVEYELLPAPPDADEERELARIWQAMMLSPTIEVCEALLRGEKVPEEKLDPEWVERLGLR